MDGSDIHVRRRYADSSVRWLQRDGFERDEMFMSVLPPPAGSKRRG